MAELESNLLYATAQQTKPWRAGTPGRAPRYRRAVVDYRRPLCLYMPKKLIFAALVAVLAGGFRPAQAQETTPRKAGIQIRVGAMAFSPLVEDRVRSRAVADSIDADQSTQLSVRQQIAPTIALAVLLPLRGRTELEGSVSFATSSLQGEDDFGSWDVGNVAVANAVIGVAYAYRPRILLHGGAGMTRLFAEDEGLFSKGNNIRPLVEAGVSWVTPMNSGLQLDARVQTHTFATAALRDEDAEEGSVFRLAITGSYTLGRSER